MRSRGVSARSVRPDRVHGPPGPLGGMREAHLSTERASPCSQARLPGADEHPRRQGHLEGPARQRPQALVRLTGRVRGRRSFARLLRDGRRARAGALWCTYVHDPSASPPQVAYAIGRAVGNAVVRNRVRRRLRELVAARAAILPPGQYLLGVSPAAAALSFAELAFDLDSLMRRVVGTTSATPSAHPPSARSNSA